MARYEIISFRASVGMPRYSTYLLVLCVLCWSIHLAEAKETPREIVLKTISAVQQGDYQTFQKYIHPNFLESLFALDAGLSEGDVRLSEKQKAEARRNFDRQLQTDFQQGKGSSLFDCASATVLKERVLVDEAQVIVQCARQEDKTETVKLVVRKVEGKWKVLLPEFWEDSRKRIITLRNNKQYEEALRESMRLASRFSNSGNIRGMVAEIYLNDLKQTDQALEYALQIKQDLPQHPAGFYLAAKAYDRSKQYASCITVLKELVEFEKWYGYFRDLGACYYRNGQYPEAFLAWEQVSQSSPEAWEKFQGWYIWLKGRLQKEKFFATHQTELKQQAASRDAQQKAIALVKCGTLDIPETIPLIEQLSKDPALKTAAERLKTRVIVDPDFTRKMEAPPQGQDAQQVPASDALEAIWKMFDSIPIGVRTPPPLAGKYLMESMLEYYKQNPSFTHYTVIQINEKGDALSLGLGWIPLDGRLLHSEDYPEFVGANYVANDAIHILSAGFRFADSSITLATYRLSGKDLIVSTESWSEYGDIFHRSDSDAKYVRAE